MNDACSPSVLGRTAAAPSCTEVILLFGRYPALKEYMEDGKGRQEQKALEAGHLEKIPQKHKASICVSASGRESLPSSQAKLASSSHRKMHRVRFEVTLRAHLNS